MPIVPVKLIPGVNVERTPVLLEAGYSISQLGRFRDGLYQKIGGWQKFYASTVPSVPRDLHAWEDINGTSRLAVGSTGGLSIIASGNITSITPQSLVSDIAVSIDTSAGSNIITIHDANVGNLYSYDAVFFNTPISVDGVILSGLYQVYANGGAGIYQILSATPAVSGGLAGGIVPQFTTTNGSEIVKVTFPNHGVSASGQANFPIATTGGGVTISGTYTVDSVIDSSNFNISVNTLATSGTAFYMNGGNAEYAYRLAIGPVAASIGYGVGGYGVGGYGSGTSPSGQTGTPIAATNWSDDNWGSFLISAPASGGIYYWDPNGGFATSIPIGAAPAFCGGVFVAMPQRQLVAWGAAASLGIGVQRDPLLIAWSDIEDFNTWLAASTNQAGTFRLSAGSRIVGAIQGPQQALIFTDLDAWAMNYIGPPLVYGFNKVGANCGLAAQHAVTQLGGVVYWMGSANFFMFGAGGVQPIPCPVWDAVYQDLDTANLSKCCAGANTLFNEVIFFYPSLSGGTGDCDKYVKYNTVERTWDYGTMPRTAWIDQSVLGNPLSATPNSLIYQQETTNDADGSAITCTMQTGYFALTEGHDKSFVDWIWPDMKWGPYGGSQSAQVYITIFAINYPTDTPIQYGPYLMTSSTPYVNTRLRARFIAIQLQSSDIGSFWRIGGLKIRIAPDGHR